MPRMYNGYYYAEVKLDGEFPTVKRIPRRGVKLDFVQRNAYIREWLKELGYAEVEVLNVQG